MGRHPRGTYAAIAALIAITSAAGPAEAGASAPQVVRVGNLQLSDHPAGIAWLDGRVLHTPSGATIGMPWTARAAKHRSLHIVRHTLRGWLLEDFSNSARHVWLVRDGHRTKLSSTGVSEGDVVSVVTSTDHRRYAVTDYDGDATATVTVRDLRGDVVASRTFDGDGAVLDFSGADAVIGTSGTQRWSIGDDTVSDLGVDAVGASLAHDVLLVKDGTGQVGPTSLSSPATPAWTAAMTQPRISPGGGRVVSRPTPGSQDLEVRALLDGSVLRQLQMRFLASEVPVWASNRAFGFIGATTGLGDLERMARCTVAGHCSAYSVVRPRDRISIPPL